MNQPPVILTALGNTFKESERTDLYSSDGKRTEDKISSPSDLVEDSSLESSNTGTATPTELVRTTKVEGGTQTNESEAERTEFMSSPFPRDLFGNRPFCIHVSMEIALPNYPQDKKAIYGLLDSGATCTVIPEHIMDRFNFPYEVGDVIKLQYATSSEEVRRKHAHLRVTFQGNSHDLDVTILRADQALIGCDFLTAFSLAPDLKRRTVFSTDTGETVLDNLKVTTNPVSDKHQVNKCSPSYFMPPLSFITFRLCEQVVLKANHVQKVLVTSNEKLKYPVDIQGNKNLFIHQMVKPMAQLAESNNHDLFLTNFNDRDQIIRKGTVVAYGFKPRQVVNFMIVPDKDSAKSKYGFKAIPSNTFNQVNETFNAFDYLNTHYAQTSEVVQFDNQRKSTIVLPKEFDAQHPEVEKLYGKFLKEEPTPLLPDGSKPHVNCQPQTTFEEMDWTVFNINENLIGENLLSLKKVLYKFRTSFAYSKFDIASVDRSKLPEIEIDTGDHAPVKSGYVRRSPADRAAIEELVDTMLKQGVIEPSDSPWSSPVVMVMKKDGSTRFCCDYRALNKVTRKDSWPLPRIDEAMDCMAGAKWFSSLDMFSGYWMLPLSKEAQPKDRVRDSHGLIPMEMSPVRIDRRSIQVPESCQSVIGKTQIQVVRNLLG